MTTEVTVTFAKCVRCGFVHIIFDLTEWTQVCRDCGYGLFEFTSPEPRITVRRTPNPK